MAWRARHTDAAGAGRRVRPERVMYSGVSTDCVCSTVVIPAHAGIQVAPGSGSRRTPGWRCISRSMHLAERATCI